MARTVRSSAGAKIQPTTQQTNIGGTVIFEVSPEDRQNKSTQNRIDSILENRDISPANAKDALRNAPTKAIQNAVHEKTGKTVSEDKIERARQKALSPDGQRKINEALKRRDEIDFSTIREKLKQ